MGGLEINCGVLNYECWYFMNIGFGIRWKAYFYI